MNTSVQGAIKRTSVTLDNFKFTSIIIFLRNIRIQN